jgi:hypothetical protein
MARIAYPTCLIVLAVVAGSAWCRPEAAGGEASAAGAPAPGPGVRPGRGRAPCPPAEPCLEVRAGAENTWDTQAHNLRTLLYLMVRFVF